MLENLKAATFDVFETMFFLFPQSSEATEVRFADAAFQAWVPIVGPKSCQVGLTVPLALAQKMAANFLGTGEDASSRDELEDMVREAANMVAGNFLSREQAPASFHMEPPRSRGLDGGTPPWRSRPHGLLFTVDDHALEIFLEKIT
jgi:CheY-specific phosphatase CheX